MVKRAQVEIKYHAALMDAYTEHLTVLEMTLIAGAEQKPSAEAAANPSVETAEQKRSVESAEQKRSTEAAANPTVETPAQKRSADAAANLGVEAELAAIGGRPGDSLKRKHA
jgi:hypothetical protein